AWPTSAGQGALAVEVRGDDPFGAELSALTDPDAEVTALLERAVLRRLEAGCAAPVGITARVLPGGELALVAEVYALDGAHAVRVER
ncbi:hydroxymethylbilane synthase, partial [Streptomyces turgidiscabies]